MIAASYKWGWTRIPVHYRLSFTVEANGVPRTGATVVQVTYQTAPSWQAWAFLDGGPIEIYKGEAATLPLPDGKMLCLTVRGQAVVDAKLTSAALLAHRLLSPPNQSSIDASNASRVSGSAEIPLELLPTIVIFEDPKNPHTAHLFDPEHAERWLGPDGKFVGAQIAVTTEPLSTGIGEKLSWLSYFGGVQRLTDSRDPYHNESSGHNLFKADFY